MIVDALACAKEHEIAIEVLTKKQILSRFKGIHIPYGMIGIFQSPAVFLYVDECVNCFVDSTQS